MHALISRQHLRKLQDKFTPARSPVLPKKSIPSLHPRPRQQQKNYYFDAGQQTVKTFRVLLDDLKAATNSLGIRPSPKLLMLTFEKMLHSICPGHRDDQISRTHFLSLLRMHLSGMNAAEIKNLSQSLKAAGFSCYVTESVIDDELYLDHGFSNGPPHCSTRTLLQSEELFSLLDDLEDVALRSAKIATNITLLSPEQTLAARAALTHCAKQWSSSEHSIVDLDDIAHKLESALDLQPIPGSLISAGKVSRASALEWKKNYHLIIDSDVVGHLALAGNDFAFPQVLRDLLELQLIRKMFGICISPDELTITQRSSLLSTLEHIMERSPPAAEANMSAHAAAVMARAHNFGRIQIAPTAGVALGHAWISPDLSLMPDTAKKGKDIGTRYMHSGFQLAPRECSIREWPHKFVSTEENQQMHPADCAWHLTVPVDHQRLQQGIDKLKRQWAYEEVPYRFIGTEPGMPATGCRMTVWHAVQRGMDADELALFRHYNLGLPEPESPTELWIRLNGLMNWIKELAPKLQG